MNTSIPSQDEFAARREVLKAEIAKQRGELTAAYLNLEKPIRYTEYSLKGIGFLRSNPWIFVAVPAVFSVASNLLSLGKKKSPKSEITQSKSAEKQPGAIGKVIRTIWDGGWQLFQLYRRVRPYFP